MTVDAARAIALHNEGVSARLIAFELGCTTRTVSRIRARHGLTQELPANTGAPVSAERLEQARAMLEAGASHKKVRVTLGMSGDTLRRHFPDTAWTRQQSGQAGGNAKAARS